MDTVTAGPRTHKCWAGCWLFLIIEIKNNEYIWTTLQFVTPLLHFPRFFLDISKGEQTESILYLGNFYLISKPTLRYSSIPRIFLGFSARSVGRRRGDMILSSASGPILPLSPIVCSPLRTDLLAASRHSKICFFCILFFHGITHGQGSVPTAPSVR